MKTALRYLIFALLALVLTTVLAVYLVIRLALAPGPDEWPAQVKAGPFTIDIGVPTALRMVTSSWFGPLLDGHTFATGHGPVRFGWDESNDTLELVCAPCSASVPALGEQPIRVERLRATAHRDAGIIDGVLEASPASTAPGATGSDGNSTLRARWNSRLGQKGMQLNIDAAEAPIVRWYTLLAPSLPELQHARIQGTLALRAQVALPGGKFSIQPQISQFSVDGLGTEAMLGARTSCGAPSRLASDSWLARAVLAAEDQRFFTHPGYDIVELVASLDANQKASRVERGGSTLTQQLARLLVTGSERSADRKLRELLYAVEMEETLGKPRILQLYLDNAPWGADLCGAEAAARRYFKRSARNLEPAQAVWMAAMLNNPAVAVEKWKRDGSIDAERVKMVAEGIRGISRTQREALLKSAASARFAPP